jgi:hypothetical protein
VQSSESSLIDDSPYYVFVALCIVVIVVSLKFKMAYFLSWPVQELLKKARVRCLIANRKIFAKTFNIFIRGRYLYQWYHYNHNAKRYENVTRGIINYIGIFMCLHAPLGINKFYYPTLKLFCFSITQHFTHSKLCFPNPFLFGATPRHK